MRQRDHEAQIDVDQHSDPHSLLFGPDDDATDGAHRHGDDRPSPAGRHSRVDHARGHRQRRRRKRLMWLLSLLGVLVVAVAAWVIVPKVTALVHPPDYSGEGSGRVRITVAAGDTASDIAATLRKAGVVKSDRAFVDAASDDPDSQGIQPGTYVLHSHMSAKSALELLLDPSSRTSTGDVLVTEGATKFDVRQRLVKLYGADKKAAVDKALDDVRALGIPINYEPGKGGSIRTVEGFLYPATYPVDPASSPVDALQKMITRFTEADRAIGFATAAKKAGLTPYQALIIASIAQSEAKYPDDMKKVVRVILNRIAARTPLKIDATTRYGALVKGVDPDKITYATFPSPYNSYTHDGLPPTPISNPGSDALDAAVHPAKGDWMYYVNGDAEGHLYFTADEHDFAAHAEKCRANHWGCG